MAYLDVPNVSLKGVSACIPKAIIENKNLDIFKTEDFSKFLALTGVERKRVAGDDICTSDLCYYSAEKLLTDQDWGKSDIDYIIFVSQTSDYVLPATSCLLQERLGLKTSIGALDFNQGCSGFIYGLSLAKGLLCAQVAKNVLLFTSETYSKYIHARDKGNRTIFGDAAAATFVSADGFAEISDFSLGTDGRGAKNLIVETGGSRCTTIKNNITWNENGNPVSPDHLYMNGTEIFNFTLETVPLLINDILVKNGLLQTEIDMFILHQANKHLMEFLRKKLRIESEKFYYYIENVGNTVSSTIPIALKEAIKEGKIHSDNEVLIAGFGVGYSWGGTILRF